MNRALAFLPVLQLCLAFTGLPAAAEVKVWQDTLPLPTYQEGPPDPEPPLYVFNPNEASVYPYTMRLGFTKKRFDHDWRAVHLENEYLSCTALPDLGGHLFCKDKVNGQEMFYTNSVVKKVQVGLRGAWIAMGLEMNFPIGHTWVTVSGVDFATAQNPDGSASIWVGNIDRVDGMQWRVEFVLRPGSTILEQNVHLENRNDVRHRYYWWNNAGIPRVDDKTRFIYPAHAMATHGLTEIDTWPVNSAGVDMSVVGNPTRADVGIFAHGCREPFMAVYHPTSRTGTVHYAAVSQVPGKKVWYFGRDGEKAAAAGLSDDNKGYIEMQAGAFENQETFRFLEPGESKKFTEYWMPVRDLGGVSRANLAGVLNLARSPGAGDVQLTVEFNANHKIPGARLRVTDGSKTVMEEKSDLDPATPFSKTVKNLPSKAHYTFQLFDGAGKLVLSHTEDQYSADLAASMKIGRQAKPDNGEARKTVADFLKLGEHDELQGLPGLARSTYEEGLRRFAADVWLSKALGRLAASEGRFEEAIASLSQAQKGLPRDPEIHYYLGIAYRGLGDDAKARPEFESVPQWIALHAAAALELAALHARAQDSAGALKLVDDVLAQWPDLVEAGSIQVAVLRRLGQAEKARRQLAVFRRFDPTDEALRYEETKLGRDDGSLWTHLGADPERVLNVAVHFMALGDYDDALDLLGRKYPAPVDALVTEPGSMLPQHHPLVGYYRAYCLLKKGQDAAQALQDASGLFTEYVFPNRASSFPVLEAALKQNPSDATALFLLGELYASSEEVDKAIAAWQKARSLNWRRPELYRDLGRALGDLKRDQVAATVVYQQGRRVAPGDVALQKGFITRLRSPSSASPAAAATDAEKREPVPPKIAIAQALTFAAQGNFAEASGLFTPLNFPAEKQDSDVREAYIEIQVQKVVALARARRCEEALASEDGLGNEDPALPFTFHGFGAILKGPRIQYTLAAVDAICGNEKGARKTWSRLAKSSVKDVADPDFVVPLMAAAAAGMEDAKSRVEAALGQVESALASKAPANRAALLYSRGILLRMLGRERDAESSLTDALEAEPPPMVSYLALTALKQH